MCVHVGTWVCVREHLQRDQPPGGVDASLQRRERKGAEVANQPTRFESLGAALHSSLLIYLFGLRGGKCAPEIGDGEGSKSDTANEAVKVAPTAGVPRRTSAARTFFYYDRCETSQQGGRREGERWKKRKRENHHLSPNRGKEKETKRALLYHRRP